RDGEWMYLKYFEVRVVAGCGRRGAERRGPYEERPDGREPGDRKQGEDRPHHGGTGDTEREDRHGASMRMSPNSVKGDTTTYYTTVSCSAQAPARRSSAVGSVSRLWNEIGRAHV